MFRVFLFFSKTLNKKLEKKNLKNVRVSICVLQSKRERNDTIETRPATQKRHHHHHHVIVSLSTSSQRLVTGRHHEQLGRNVHVGVRKLLPKCGHRRRVNGGQETHASAREFVFWFVARPFRSGSGASRARVDRDAHKTSSDEVWVPDGSSGEVIGDG